MTAAETLRVAAARPPRRRARFPNKALYAFLSIYCVLNLFPLLWLVLSSFKTNNEIYEAILALPRDWLFSNYGQA